GAVDNRSAGLARLLPAAAPPQIRHGLGEDELRRDQAFARRGDLPPRRGRFGVRGVVRVERGDEAGAVGKDHGSPSSYTVSSMCSARDLAAARPGSMTLPMSSYAGSPSHVASSSWTASAR